MGLNVAAWNWVKKCQDRGETKRAFIADLRKHFLHELFQQKAKEIGKDVNEANAALAKVISIAENIPEAAQRLAFGSANGTVWAKLIEQAI